MTPLHDESGTLLGYFATAGEYERIKALEEENKRLLYEWAKTAVTDEELDEAEAADTEEYTTDEVLTYIVANYDKK
jgi:hypothetical protein